MKKSIITLAGDLASGKGTVATLLSKKLGYEIYSNGTYFRKLALDRGMNVTEFNKYVEKHPEIDREIERSAEKYAKEHDNLIVDARLGWYVVPDSFKVYLTVDIDEAAKRAFNDSKRKNTEKFESVAMHKEDLIKRYNLENERYYKLYGVRKDDMNNYNFVLDTTTLTPNDVVNKILVAYLKWKEE